MSVESTTSGDEDKITVGILTVSDRCSSGESTDVSGQNLAELIKAGIIDNAKVAASGCVADDERSIVDALEHWCDHLHLDLILTTGGTGVAPRDVTPEAVRAVIHKEASGISILMTTSSLKSTPFAALARPVCGIRNKSLIVTLPGSCKGSEECLRCIACVLPHALDLINNKVRKLSATHEALQSIPVVKPESKSSPSYQEQNKHHHAHHHHCAHQHHHPHHHHHHHHHEHTGCSSKARVDDVCGRPRKSPYEIISVDQAQEIVFSMVSSKEPVELPLEEAAGFVLSEDVVSQYPLPPFPASVKDGYAVIAADGAGTRKVVDAVAAGDLKTLKGQEGELVIRSGECVRINTGAPLPQGADAVVQVSFHIWRRILTKPCPFEGDGRDVLGWYRVLCLEQGPTVVFITGKMMRA
ncbi:MoaB/Mog domain [Trinorchestia longiramus]|nr:MoaB/Mog domain [Trinorchestia longiramus]